jgi:gentisate 1,2-dioxygenase
MNSELTDLYAKMSQQKLQPLWTLEGEILSPKPAPKMQAHLWKWETLYRIAESAGRLVPVERGGDRRAIALSNPGLGGLPYATHTIWAAIQWLNPREIAPAHRHTSQAVRFIIDGAGSYSTVEGDKVYLKRGDLVLTPQFLWHDHGSESDERAIWLDGLDIPLTNYLAASFFEPHPQAQQKISAALDGTVLKYGVGTLTPAWEKRSTEHPPLFVYPWADAERAMHNLGKVAASPFDDVFLEYINPHTGGAVMHTFGCRIQTLRPGVHTKAHRHTSSTVYYVVEGDGYTVIDGTKFTWGRGDVFVVPTWAVHEHCNVSVSDRAILFSMDDQPLMRAAKKYFEAEVPANGGYQEILREFTTVN